ncbi:hypothetical protein J2Z34_002932 [Youngiibacter multivorans]|uniref:Uncharacterized protein n=2 Tax=Youngiibacter multivorans TaxID=937251 RepID=A0ABS4G7B0_9CLOT|nr:hypothetical protein [Youngiibacter multivorans]
MSQNDILLTREELYEEVWTLSVSGVAKKYGVDYPNLLKICKNLKIPIPSMKYWALRNTDEQMEIDKLPESDNEIINIALKKRIQVLPINEVKSPERVELVEKEPYLIYKDSLLFMEDNDKLRVFQEAEIISVIDRSKRFSKPIIDYRKIVDDWNEKDRKEPLSKKTPDSYSSKNPPFLAGVISNDTLHRVFRILDTLLVSVEKLGGNITNSMEFIIRGEVVKLAIYEYQDQVEHVLTKDEKQKLLEYEYQVKRGKYAYKPDIKKYDYVFNGRINVSSRKGKYYKDTKTDSIENQIGLILIELYEQSEIVRLARLEAEERERIWKEEQERQRAYKQRKAEEIQKTIELRNCAIDFDTACKIRAFITAIKMNPGNIENVEEWLEWARKKADWFDPTVAIEDEYLGKRNHGADEEQKQLKTPYGYWW